MEKHQIAKIIRKRLKLEDQEWSFIFKQNLTLEHLLQSHA